MTKDQVFWKNILNKNAVLNPVDRISEVLFGLIMVLSFTGAISIATHGREQVRELLWAALGCNVAWGFVDAIMYLMAVLFERGHNLTVIQSVSRSEGKEASRQALKEEIQPLIARLLTDAELDQLCERLRKIQKPGNRNMLTGADLIVGLQIFLLVFLCTLPVSLPFVFIKEVSLAIRASNGIALLLLFIGGYILAGYAGFNRFVTAVIYVVIGVILVTLTMALGG
jgi:VIT family